MAMTEEYKLQVSLDLVDQLTDLLEENEYKDFFYSHLISMQAELNRQLTNSQNQSKIEE
jgi:hypothetical protein